MKNRFKKFLDFDDPNKLMPWKDKSPEPQGEEPEDRPEIAIKPAWYFAMYFIMGVGFDTLFPTNVFPEKVRFMLGVGAGARRRDSQFNLFGALQESPHEPCDRCARARPHHGRPL